MGVCPSKRSSSSHGMSEKEYKKLAHKVRLLQKEMTALMSQREEESQAYEREVTSKEAEWKRERKKLRDEVRRLRRSLKEKEMAGEDEDMTLKEGQCGSLDSGATGFLVEQMKEERARRDEAVEKWKMLYLAIKAELDDLIQRTHQGGEFYWKAEEDDFMEDIRKELKTKEETIEVLRAQLTSMEQQECRRNREVDILRQSLKIMSSKKKATAPKHARCVQVHT